MPSHKTKQLLTMRCIGKKGGRRQFLHLTYHPAAHLNRFLYHCKLDSQLKVWIIILALIFGFVLFNIADEPLDDTKEKTAWRAEYHPSLTIKECSEEAGC